MCPDLTHSVKARVPTPIGEFHLHHYDTLADGKEHLALVYGDIIDKQEVLVRVHSECFTGDVFGSLRCDCGPQLQQAMELIVKAGRGVIIYLRQEGRGIGLAAKLRAYNLQDEGHDTVEANLMLGHQADERGYQPAAAILADLGVASIQLLTNNPEKIEGLAQNGIKVVTRVPLETEITAENRSYLETKVSRMRHMLNLNNGHRAFSLHPSIPINAINSSTNGNTTPDIAPFTPEIAAQLRHLRQRIAAHSNCNRPFITLSYAQSLDGSLTKECGQPTAISGAESMTVTHSIRASHDAILVGVNTVLADDPRLNVRLVTGESPTPIVLDSQLRIPTIARLFDAHEKVLIVTTESSDHPKVAELQARGASLLHLEGTPHLRIPLNKMLICVRQLGLQSIMVEGGGTILTSFLANHHVDHLAVTVAPCYLGGYHVFDSQANANNKGRPSLPRVINPAWTTIGSDLILWGAVAA